MRVPSPPVVTAAVAGFVGGVLVALLATGVLSRPSHGTAASPTPAPAPVQANLVAGRVRRIVMQKLGPLTNEHLPRVVSVEVQPAILTLDARGTRVGAIHYQSVQVVFRLNNHPLGPSWRLKAAKADVFAVMQALYSSDLPVYDTLLIGRFPLGSGKQVRESRAMVAYMDHARAQTLPWKRWGRENEALLWAKLSYHWLDPRFA